MALGEEEQGIKVGEMELAIGIGEGNAVKARRGKAAAQGRPIAEIFAMRHEAQTREIVERSRHDLGGAVAAAVIDNHNLVVAGYLCQRLIGFRDRPANAGLFVVSGNNQRQGRTCGRAAA